MLTNEAKMVRDLASKTGRLAKKGGASAARLNYVGTGAAAAHRQLWVRYPNGAVIDVWFRPGAEPMTAWVTFGGVVARGGGPKPTPFGVAGTVEEMAAVVVAALSTFAKGGEAAA